ncbi:hypothetical protein ACTQ8A_005070, partial [Escherichia coli]
TRNLIYSTKPTTIPYFSQTMHEDSSGKGIPRFPFVRNISFCVMLVFYNKNHYLFVYINVNSDPDWQGAGLTSQGNELKC